VCLKPMRVCTWAPIEKGTGAMPDIRRDEWVVDSWALLSVTARVVAIRSAMEKFFSERVDRSKIRDGMIYWADQEPTIAREGMRLQILLHEAASEKAYIEEALRIPPTQPKAWGRLEIVQHGAGYFHTIEVNE
jgi:hypothetical protein